MFFFYNLTAFIYLLLSLDSAACQSLITSVPPQSLHAGIRSLAAAAAAAFESTLVTFRLWPQDRLTFPALIGNLGLWKPKLALSNPL